MPAQSETVTPSKTPRKAKVTKKVVKGYTEITTAVDRKKPVRRNRADHEISRLNRTVKLCIPKTKIKNLVKIIAQDISPKIRFRKAAIEGLHIAAEKELVDIFNITNINGRATSRETGINHLGLLTTIFNNEKYQMYRTPGLYVRWHKFMLWRQQALETTRILKQKAKRAARVYAKRKAKEGKPRKNEKKKKRTGAVKEKPQETEIPEEPEEDEIQETVDQPMEEDNNENEDQQQQQEQQEEQVPEEEITETVDDV